MRLREEMFSKLLRLPVSYYDDNAFGPRAVAHRLRRQSSHRNRL